MMTDVELPIAVGDEIVVRMRVTLVGEERIYAEPLQVSSSRGNWTWLPVYPGEYERATRQVLPDRETLAQVIGNAKIWPDESVPFRKETMVLSAADAILAALRERGMG
jgi:hypothetical protein